MSPSLQSATGEDRFSVMELARELDMSRPISVRELIAASIRQFEEEPPSTTSVRWSNWVDDHDDRREEFAPRSRLELEGAVAYMVANGKRFRAVGSGHSHSNAPAPSETYVNLKHLSGQLPTDPGGWLKPERTFDLAPEEHLVRVKAGTTLRDLNRQVLADRSTPGPTGLALKNMGSFDGQTIAGAINTATHGTGIHLSTLADMVRSVEMVTVQEDEEGEPVVQTSRIEPTGGITDPASFESRRASHRMELIQDDDVFYSVVAGFGCMGIAYAYTLVVRDAYWLRERSELMGWHELREQLDVRPGEIPDVLERSRHLQVLLNVADASFAAGDLVVDDPDPICLVRTHDVVDDVPDKPDDWEKIVDNRSGEDRKLIDVSDPRWPPERRKVSARDALQAVGNSFHPLKDNNAWKVTGLSDGWDAQMEKGFLRPEANRKPFVKKRERTASYIALRRLRDRNTSDENYERPPAPPDPAISTDVAVPLHDLVDAVNDVLGVVNDVYQTHEVDPVWRKAARAITFWNDGPEPREEEFKVHFGVPMGIRFIAPSDHYLSAAFDQWSAMIEVPFPVEAANAKLMPNVPDVSQEYLRESIAKPALAEIEGHLVDEYGGRPHMGKHNTLDSSDLDELYDEFEGVGSWMESYRRFNPEGTFDNAFTDQLGISQG